MPSGKEYRAHYTLFHNDRYRSPDVPVSIRRSVVQVDIQRTAMATVREDAAEQGKGAPYIPIKLTTHVYSYFYYEETAFPPFLLCRKFPLPCRKLFVGRRSPDGPVSNRRSVVQGDRQRTAKATVREEAAEQGKGCNFIVIPQPITVIC